MSLLTIPQAFELALQHQQAGRLQQAELLYRQILAEQPAHEGAILYTGVMAHQQGRNDVALDLIRKAIALNPDVPEAYNSLGVVLLAQRRFHEAIVAFRQALLLRAGYPNAQYNLGQALNGARQFEEAIIAYRQAILLDPGFANTHNNLGNALMELGQIHAAIAAYEQAVALEPTLPEAHYNLALALLARGDFNGGWDEHEWRWKCKNFSSPQRNFAQPLWDGSPFDDRTLLLHCEQGFGDAIQFIRYLPLVARRGGKIIIECQPELEGLLGALSSIVSRDCQIISCGQSLPSFDLHCPLLSLPRVFNTTLENIPAEVPYLFPDPKLIDFWRERLLRFGSDLKIGLAWAGSPTHKTDQSRSISLGRLGALAEVRGARFFSLQKGLAAAQGKFPPPGLELIDWTDEFNNFNDAALMANLNLIITVDTSVAHLAAALARPTWVLLSFVPDWRWLLDREDSPWYPTMRLFRQRSRGDWDGVIRRVVEAVAALDREH